MTTFTLSTYVDKFEKQWRSYGPCCRTWGLYYIVLLAFVATWALLCYFSWFFHMIFVCYWCIVLHTLLSNILFTLIFRTKLALSCGAPSGLLPPPPTPLSFDLNISRIDLSREFSSTWNMKKKNWKWVKFLLSGWEGEGMRVKGYFSKMLQTRENKEKYTTHWGQCTLFSVVLTPPPPATQMAVFGSYLSYSSLYS